MCAQALSCPASPCDLNGKMWRWSMDGLLPSSQLLAAWTFGAGAAKEVRGVLASATAGV